MAHRIEAALDDISALAAAVKDLEWYTGKGGYRLKDVTVEGGVAVWVLGPVPPTLPEKRRVVSPGDEVQVETKGQQMSRRYGGSAETVEGTVSRVLTRGPHPRGMKVQLRDGTVGRVMKNLTVPGAGEPSRY